MIGQILLFIVAFSGIVLMFWCLGKHQQNKNFQRFMKPGIMCKYKKDNNGDWWLIRSVTGDRIDIFNPFSEELLKDVSRQDLYV